MLPKYSQGFLFTRVQKYGMRGRHQAARTCFWAAQVRKQIGYFAFAISLFLCFY